MPFTPVMPNVACSAGMVTLLNITMVETPVRVSRREMVPFLISPIRTVLSDEERRHWPFGNSMSEIGAISEMTGAGDSVVKFEEAESSTFRKSALQATEECCVNASVARETFVLEMANTSSVTSAMPVSPRALGNVCTRIGGLELSGSMRKSCGVVRSVTRSCPLDRIAMFSIHVPSGNWYTSRVEALHDHGVW